MLQLKQLVGLFSFFFYSCLALAGGRTYFATGSMPFCGYYKNGKFAGAHFSTSKIDRFGNRIPVYFRPGDILEGMNKDGVVRHYTIKTSRKTYFIGYNEVSPLVYREGEGASLMWTGHLPVKLRITEKASVDPKIIAKIKREYLKDILDNIDFSDPYMDKNEMSALKRLRVDTLPAPKVVKLKNTNDIVYLIWPIKVNNKKGQLVFFTTNMIIYSKRQSRIVYRVMEVTTSNGEIDSKRLEPELFFNLNNHDYLLAYYFDGYEDEYPVILDAHTGKVVISGGVGG